jgi:type IV secretion system protein VirB2
MKKTMAQYNRFCRSLPQSMLYGMLMLMLLFLAFPAHAQLQKVNELMTAVQNALTAISVTSVTIAVILTGYKMAFKGDSLGDCAPVLVGGVVIGAAIQIAQMLVG